MPLATEFDRDRSGDFDREEVKSLLETRSAGTTVSDELLNWIMQSHGAGSTGNSTIPASSVLNALHKCEQWLQLDRGIADKMASLMTLHDFNHDAELKSTELISMLKHVASDSLCREVDDGDVAIVLEMCDDDHSGGISFLELQSAIAAWLSIISKEEVSSAPAVVAPAPSQSAPSTPVSSTPAPSEPALPTPAPSKPARSSTCIVL